MKKRKILYLPPAGLSEDILSETAVNTLENLGNVIWNETGRNYSSDELLEIIPGAEVIIHEDDSVTVDYVRDGEAVRVTGDHCVLACYNAAIPYLCPQLPESQKEALDA